MKAHTNPMGPCSLPPQDPGGNNTPATVHASPLPPGGNLSRWLALGTVGQLSALHSNRNATGTKHIITTTVGGGSRGCHTTTTTTV
jgi:hypothetical protein